MMVSFGIFYDNFQQLIINPYSADNNIIAHRFAGVKFSIKVQGSEVQGSGVGGSEFSAAAGLKSGQSKS